MRRILDGSHFAFPIGYVFRGEELLDANDVTIEREACVSVLQNAICSLVQRVRNRRPIDETMADVILSELYLSIVKTGQPEVVPDHSSMIVFSM